VIRERTHSFRAGMVDSASSADDYAADACELILNGRVERDNCVAAVGGSRLLSLSPPTVTDYGRGIVEFTPTSGTRELVKFTQTSTTTTVSYSTNSGQSWATVATLASTSGDWSLATMTKSGVNYLLGAVGATTMFSYSGGGSANWATVTGPTTGCKYIAVHNERLWATTGNSTVYGSKVADFTVWAAPDGLVLPVQTHDGENITGIAQAGPVLLVFKRHSTAYIDGFGDSDIIVAAGTRGISPSVGCIAPRTFQSVGGGYVWLSERGLELWSGSGAPSPVAEGATEYISTIARNRITNATGTGSAPTLPCSAYWPEKQEYWVAWPSDDFASTDTTAVNDGGLILNMRTGAVSRRVWNPPGNTGSRKLYPGAMCMAEVTIDDRSYVRPVVLTKAGDVLAMDYGETEMEGPSAVLPTLTTPVLILDADREAWRRGLSVGESLSLTGLTVTDDSGSGNDCTASGSVTLIHDGTGWVFRCSEGRLASGAINLTGTSEITAGVRVRSGRPANSVYSCPEYFSAAGFRVQMLANLIDVTMASAPAGIPSSYVEFVQDTSEIMSLIQVASHTPTHPLGQVVYRDGMELSGTVGGLDTTGPFSNSAVIVGGAQGANFTGDIVRFTLQSTAIGTTEVATLNTYLTDGSTNSRYSLDFRFRSRPYDFGEPVDEKWLRRVVLGVIETTDQTVTVIPLVDGAESDAWQFVDVPEATGDKPQRHTVYVSERGLNHQVEIRGAGGLKISAVEVQAEPLVSQY
jgi:hypothetical protein